MYLVTVDQKHIEVSEEQERKLTALIREGKIPPKIKLNDTILDTSTILGFTKDKPKIATESQNKPKTWEELRAFVHQQDWYKRSKSHAASGRT